MSKDGNHHTVRRKNKPFLSYRNVIARFTRSRDFTDIEDSVQAGKMITQLASAAISGAISEAKAMGITRVYAVDGQIISENANGIKTVIGLAENSGKEFFVKYIPGTIMHAAKR